MLAILLALSIVPAPEPLIRDAVSLTHVNHFYDPEGRHVFDQVIFWRWEASRYVVMEWRLLKQPEHYPFREHSTGGYRTNWTDGERPRSVWSRDYREDWTQADPELADREVTPKEMRRGLKPHPSLPLPQTSRESSSNRNPKSSLLMSSTVQVSPKRPSNETETP